MINSTRVSSMMFKFLMLLLFELARSQNVSQSDDYYDQLPRVLTDSGSVIGQFIKSEVNSVVYAAYTGIPYAEPPVGYFRFKPAVPVTPWEGDRIAYLEAESCIQFKDNAIFGSEDCLYLNVYTPKTSKEDEYLRPVMVWIHGGEFAFGNASRLLYGPEFLLQEDVIVVSIQYRLGPFGFLNLNHPYAAGNVGLKDQVLALHWIQQNIYHFGGNPNQVTLLGQSAGGVAVDLHKLSDMSAGLFSQTISMSASPLCSLWAFQSNSDAESQAFELGRRLRIFTNDKEFLWHKLFNIKATKIIKAANFVSKIPFRPTLENPYILPKGWQFLTECALKRYQEGHYQQGPHLMGYTSAEALTFAKPLDPVEGYIDKVNAVIHKIKIPFVVNILSSPFKGASLLTDEFIQYLSDIYFVAGIDYEQKLLSETNGYPIYYYRFSFESDYSAHEKFGIEYLHGVGHEDELSYIFYRPLLNLPKPDVRTIKTIQRVVTMWTNFAKYGNPTPDPTDPLLGNIWKESGKSGQHLEINDNLKMKPRPINLVFDQYQKLGIGVSSHDNECKLYDN